MRKKLLMLTLALSGAVALGGCAQTGEKAGEAATKASTAAKTREEIQFDKDVAEAKAWKKKAASVGGEWRDTGKMMKKAEKAASEGDYATATKLVKKAKGQWKMGYEQAMAEKNAGNPDYLR